MNKLFAKLRKAVTTAAGEGGDFIPAPLSDTFISYVRDKNFLRQLFTVKKMSAKTLDIPKILGKTKVYYQPTELASAIKTDITTGTIRLTAKKFMAQADLSEEVLEDTTNIGSIVKDDFAASLAAAEEEAMLVGDPDHTPTTATESLADETTWFTKDHRIIFYGLVTLAGDIAGVLEDDTRAANRVDAGGADMSTALARQAKYNLGKYGRVYNDLILIINPWSANQLLDDPKLVTLEKYGPNATIFTGEFGKLYGKMRVIESSYMPDTYGLITHVGNPIIGDRRLYKLKTMPDITVDGMQYVITSRIDFTIMHKAALCQIHNLDAPTSVS